MKKTLLIPALILTFFVSCASAAPSRRPDEMMGLDGAELMAVQPLVNAAAGTAFQQGIPHYPRDTAPDQALVEGVLVRALRERLFPVAAKGQTLALSDGEIREAAGKLFAWPDLPAVTAPVSPGVSRTEGGLMIDLASKPDFVGVHVCSAGENEAGELTVAGDVYSLSGIEGMAEDAPEDSIRWLGHITLALKKSPGAPAGHTLVSYDADERYAAAGFRQIIDMENGYELSYPDIFPEVMTAQAPGQGLELASADGLAKITVSFVPGSLQALEDAWKAEPGLPEGSRIRVTEFGQLTLRSPREMRLAVPDERGGQCVLLSYTFPEDRPYEHSLYWEFMENSFVVYAHATG